MGYANESGYTPETIESMMNAVMIGVNSQFATSYTSETFVGTNFYKYFYVLIQKAQENQIKASEIFEYLQQYFTITNQRISRPVVTNQGLIDIFATNGFLASVKKPVDVDAGKAFICVDVEDNHARGLFTITSYANLVSGTDDVITVGATNFTAQTGAATPGAGTFQSATSNAATALSLAAQINAHATAGALVKATADGAVVNIRAKTGGVGGNAIALGYTDNDTNVGATKSGTTLTGGFVLDVNEDDYDDVKLTIGTIIKNSTVAGIVTQGPEVETIALTNGQSFDFKFFLPDRISTKLRLTNTLSENNQVAVDSPDDVKIKLLDNIQAKYRLGKNFEPQTYYSVVDAPWASQVKLEYSFNDGVDWEDEVFESEFDELLDINLEDIELVED